MRPLWRGAEELNKMQDGLDPTTVIFALLAIFVVWKLKAVLGTRVDIDKNPPRGANQAPTQDGERGNVIKLPGAAERSATSGARAAATDFAAFAVSEKGQAGLAEIQRADASFNADRFLAGAKTAYEMIVTAFAEDDKATLEKLLSPDVMASFAAVIDQRRKAGRRSETRLVSIDEIDVVDGAVKDAIAQISLMFSAKLINVERDASGAVVSGDPDLVVSTDDRWTFARPISSSDPTWRLVATESNHGG